MEQHFEDGLANVEQANSWDGAQGSVWATRADDFDRTIAGHHDDFMAAAAIKSHERVLDVGCGCGQASRDAARAAPSGSALGVDLSAEMLEVARQKSAAAGITNADYLQTDAQVHPFEAASFDAAISRFGSMFFEDPVGAFRNIAAALNPGGRLVLATWQPMARNEWFREVLASMSAGRDLAGPPEGRPGPFGLADPEQIDEILAAAGFRDVTIDGHDGPVCFGDDVDQAQNFILDISAWMLDGLDEAGRHRAMDDLRSSLSAHRTAGGVIYGSAAWIVTARRP